MVPSVILRCSGSPLPCPIKGGARQAGLQNPASLAPPTVREAPTQKVAHSTFDFISQ